MPDLILNFFVSGGKHEQNAKHQDIHIYPGCGESCMRRRL
jgi:hypothetical protein